MRVERLRPLPSLSELAVMYPEPHDHRLYGRGHRERVDATIALARTAVEWPAESCRIADLSCGNAHIARTLARYGDELHLGDFAGVHGLIVGEVSYYGAIEDTIDRLPDDVEVFVCSETIEHLDDPGKVLALARMKARQLVLSTPLDCWADSNGEHLWAWDREGVEAMMRLVGWSPHAFASVDSRTWGEPYLYGIWVAT